MRVQLHGKKKEAKASITSQARSFYIPFILHEHHVAVVATLSDRKKPERDSSELDTREIDEDLYGDGRKRLH